MMMNVPFLCVFLAFLLNHVSKIPVAVAMAAQGYDNRHPRAQQANLQGWGKRAVAAHLNGFEMFPAFGLAVVLAHFAVADVTWMNALSITFVVSRVFYVAMYLANIHLLRSLVWGVGLTCVTALFILALI